MRRHNACGAMMVAMPATVNFPALAAGGPNGACPVLTRAQASGELLRCGPWESLALTSCATTTAM